MIVKLSDKIQDLSGQGEEWLLDNRGNVIGKFFDGNLVQAISIGNNEVTIGG